MRKSLLMECYLYNAVANMHDHTILHLEHISRTRVGFYISQLGSGWVATIMDANWTPINVLQQAWRHY